MDVSEKVANFTPLKKKTRQHLIYMKRTLFRKIGLLSVLLFSAIAAQAQLKKIVFTPQWHANSQFAGYIAAREQGYYKAEGLDVVIKYPEANKSSFELLSEGKADLVTNMLTIAIAMKCNGTMDIVNVMQATQHTSLCLALKSPKQHLTIDSLRNLRVGVWYNGLSVLAEAANIQHQLNWKVTPFRQGFKLLKYGVLDAITAMEYNELLQLKYNGYDVSEHSVIHLSEHGYDIPGDGVYCLSDYYQQNAAAVMAFTRATKRGWEWCRSHPEDAVNLVAQEMEIEHINHSKVILRAGLKVILEKQELTPGQVSYQLQQDDFNEAVNILTAIGRIHTKTDFQTFIAR